MFSSTQTSAGGAPFPRARLLFYGAFFLSTTAAAGSSESSLACPSPSVWSRLSARLPHTEWKVRSGRELVVVAIGSSSTAGVGASSSMKCYPVELELQLAARFKGVSVRVVNKGVSGDTYKEMLERFDRDVLSFHPDLVIWQVGTNAVLNDDLAQAETLIRAGVERLRAAGADVVLMGPQYAPVVLRDPDCPVMLHVLDEVAREEAVPVFHRFDVMRDWVSTGQVALTSIVSADGLHMNDASYRCIADLLAEAIVGDVLPPPTPSP